MEVISRNNQTYASGGRRLLAFFIDHLLINAILSMLFWRFFDWDYSYPMQWQHWIFNFSFVGHNLVKEFIVILYYAYMEASAYQATLGKMAMGIRVVGNNGQRLDFSKALLRNLSKILSSLILGIGYIMIIFDDRKQALHDKIADTFVVKQ